MDSIIDGDKRRKIPFAVGSPEHAEEVKRRNRERWNANKDVYRKKKPEAERAFGDAPPLPPGLPIVFKIPADLHDLLGETLVLPEDWKTWPMFFVRRHSTLSKTTIQQYKSAYYNLPQGDIFVVARHIQGLPLHSRNQAAKAGLSHVSQALYDSIYVRKRKGLAPLQSYRTELLKMLVFSKLSKITKQESFTNHMAQTATKNRLDDTVSWTDWTNLSQRFIKTMVSKDTLTEREKNETLAAAVYSLVPPIRLDWNDVIVQKTRGGKAFESLSGTVGKNILFLAPQSAVVFWGEFKNVASFPDAPLKQVLPTTLVNLIQKLKPGDGKLFGLPNFGRFLTGVAMLITGKPFHNTLMRSSYIMHFHAVNSVDGVDLVKTRAEMRLLHQTDLAVHLAYNKMHELTDLPED